MAPKLPNWWLVLTGLFLVLPLLTGMVGMGRHAWARRSPRLPRPARSCAAGPACCVVLFAASVAGMAVATYWIIYLNYIP